MHDGSCARVFFEAYWASCKQETSLTFDAEQSQTAALRTQGINREDLVQTIVFNKEGYSTSARCADAQSSPATTDADLSLSQLLPKVLGSSGMVVSPCCEKFHACSKECKKGLLGSSLQFCPGKTSMGSG
jgi:hypothetical protein